MARNLLQDVIPPNRKGQAIRRVEKTLKKEELPKKERWFLKPPPSSSKKEKFPTLQPRRDFNDKWWKRPVFWWGAGGGLSIIIIAVVPSLFFSSATVEITSKTASFPVKTSFIAAKNVQDSIPFEIIVMKGAETKTVTAASTKYISEKASGKIVIYNNYSSATQKLITKTRFLGSNGKVYRTESDVTVPGMSKKDGETVPGSIGVTVYAAEPGQSYNANLMDFTVPGFKGDPRYEKFYARSKTEIAGGFSGTAPVASEKDSAIAKASVEDSLKKDLLAEASTQVPNGYILYKDAVQISFAGIKNAGNAGENSSSVNLTEEGTLVGVLLQKNAITSKLTKSIFAGAKDTQPFTFDAIDTLVFSFTGGTPAINAQTKTISFSLEGTVNATYSVDMEALKNNLAGKPRKDFSVILSGYPSIYKARVARFLPFWNRHFPGKPDKITITAVP